MTVRGIFTGGNDIRIPQSPDISSSVSLSYELTEDDPFAGNFHVEPSMNESFAFKKNETDY